LLIATSQAPALARNADSPLDATDHIVGQSIELVGVEAERAGW